MTITWAPINAGRRLLHAADDLLDEPPPLVARFLLSPGPHLSMHIVQALQGDEDERRNQVGAVIHGDMRLVLQGGDNVLVVGIVVLAADGVDGNAEVVDEAGSDVVLGAERIGGDQHEVSAASLEGAGEVGGLGGHVQAGRQAQPGERFFLLEALADAGQHGHVAVGPEDAFLARRRQVGVLDVTRLLSGYGHGPSSEKETGCRRPLTLPSPPRGRG